MSPLDAVVLNGQASGAAAGFARRRWPTRDELLALPVDLQPAYMLAPELPSDPLINLGTLPGLPPAVAGGGLTLTADGLIPGAAAASFSGSRFIDTGWTTRTNYAKNPIAAVDANSTGDLGTTGDIRRSTALPAGMLEALAAAGITDVTTGFKVDANGSADGGQQTFEVLPAGVQQTVSFYLWRADASAANLRVRIETAAAALVAGTEKLYSSAEATGKLIRHTVTFTPAATEAFRVRFDQTGVGPLQGYVTCLVCEEGASATAAFPRPSHLLSGEAAFLGTANASISDIGPFARNTDRTFLGWARRELGGGADTILGAQGTEPPRIVLLSGVTTVQFRTQRAQGAAEYGFEGGDFPGWEIDTFWALRYSDAQDAIGFSGQGEVFDHQIGNTGQFLPPGISGGLRLGVDATSTNFFLGPMLPFMVYCEYMSDARLSRILDRPALGVAARKAVVS